MRSRSWGTHDEGNDIVQEKGLDKHVISGKVLPKPDSIGALEHKLQPERLSHPEGNGHAYSMPASVSCWLWAPHGGEVWITSQVPLNEAAPATQGNFSGERHGCKLLIVITHIRLKIDASAANSLLNKN